MAVEISEEPVDTPFMRHLVAANDAQQRRDFDQAVKSYTAALRINPEHALALHNLSIILADRRQLMAAVTCARRAIAVTMPDTPHYMLANLGMVLTRMEHYGAAVELYEMLVKREPNEFRYWHNLSMALTATDSARAVECIEEARRLAPHEDRLLRDAGLLKLTCRDWRAGFRDWHDATTLRRDGNSIDNVPEWDGEPLEGKTIAVYHEQGFGDTIQFCRFLRKLNADRVLLAVPPPLVRLLELSEVVDEVLVFGELAPPCDYQSPLMGVFRHLDLDDLLAEPFAPYIVPQRRGPRVWRGPDCHLAVGVCWAGNPNYASDNLRSMPFENVLSISDIPGVQLFSLQKGAASEDVRKAGALALIPDLSEVVNDLADVAHIIDQLDLIVSVDTSVLHLAGAMDKPCIGLLPYNSCWRWGMGTNETPFYPSVELVRQESPGDWVGSMVRVRQLVSEIIERDVGALDRSPICGVALDDVGTA